MNTHKNQSLAEFLETSGYLENLRETICESLREEAELDGAKFDLKDSYWADRLFHKQRHEIKSEFLAYNIHL